MTTVLLDGVVLGLQFGILGVGLTLVFGLGGVLNLAHGQMAVVAAIIISRLIESGTSTAVAISIGIACVTVLGLFLDVTLMQPVYRQTGESRVLLGLLLMLGVGFIIDGILEWKYPIQALTLRVSGSPIPILGVDMRRGSLIASGIIVAVGALLILFFKFTTFGRATRSVIQDEEGAPLCGVNPAMVRTVIFGLSGLLAGVVAVTRAMSTPVTSTAGVDLTIFALIVAVVGGLDSVSGSFLAGLLLGIINTASAKYIGTYITTIVLLMTAGVTIVVRPSGLLGERSR